MFTGIVTSVGEVIEAEQRGDLRLRIKCDLDLPSIDFGASIACSGACLTVVDKADDWFAVDVSAETTARTAPGLWQVGATLNLERALRMGDELGGHLVTGHIDGVGHVVEVQDEGGSRRVTIEVPGDLGAMIAVKGSITLDGVSLTVNSVEDADGTTRLSVNIIPHTRQHTTLGTLETGRGLNVEIDLIARYLQRMAIPS